MAATMPQPDFTLRSSNSAEQSNVVQDSNSTSTSTSTRATTSDNLSDMARVSSSSAPHQDMAAMSQSCNQDHMDNNHRHSNSHNHLPTADCQDQTPCLPSSKHAEHAVAPFLAKHIPMQYNPLAHTQESHTNPDFAADSSTRFCYRHHPDLKCRRQANEPSMDQLQTELGTLSHSDQQAISHVWSLFSAAPSKHRHLMLQGVLSQCCFPQLSYISAAVRDLIKIDFLSALPPELGYKILCSLDTTSLCKAAQVSRRWRELADDDVVWHRMCEQHIDRKCVKCGWGLPLLERKRLRKEKRQIQLRATGRGMNEWSPTLTPLPAQKQEPVAQMLEPAEDTEVVKKGSKRSCDETSPAPERKKTCTQLAPEDDSYFKPTVRPWKDVYKDRFKVGTNWKYGRCSTKIFRGHTNGVMCLQHDDNVLITGSYDSTIKVWDIETGEEIRTLTGHTSGVRCLQFDETGRLLSGSMDGTTRLWDWRTGRLARTMNAHQGGVISVHYDSQYVASGSEDKTIRVYDTTTKSTFLLKGHTEWVNSVKIDSASRTLLSASDDCTVRLWDLDTKSCIKVFEGHVGQVQQVLPLPLEFELDEADLLPGDKDDDGSSTASSAVMHAHEHHHHSTMTTAAAPSALYWPYDEQRAAPPRYMLTGALDNTIRLWDVHAPGSIPVSADAAEQARPATTTACVRTFFGHVEGIWALAADHLRLVSGSEDRTVKIWDPRTGKCERTWTGHAGPVTCIGLSDSRLVTGSEDCEVRMLVFNSGDGEMGKCSDGGMLSSE